jgi:signal transduction histidine kinase
MAEPFAWPDVAEHAPDGLAVIDEDGRFRHLNAAGLALCGRPADELIGTPAPFVLEQGGSATKAGLLDDGAAEQVCLWAPVAGLRREFAYRARALPADGSQSVVSFRDVTAERHRRRRVAALARTSAKLATLGSITATLDALAHEVLQADAMAGVQILALDESGDRLHIMGSAGFRRWPDFFDRLVQCRRRGATLRMIDALEGRKPVVVADRWAAVEQDPAWEPLHAYLGELSWDWFASVPLTIRDRAAGVLNVFLAPGQVVGRQTLEFLVAMAEQAAVALDYASLLQNERALARRDERQRLARDLHDSIVQQVFSIGMQAKAIEVLGSRGDTMPAGQVLRIADEVGALTRTVLADLRAMVHELRPTSSAQQGLEDAVRALVASTTNRTGLRFRLAAGADLDLVPADLAEDGYRIVAEAVHNVVKHADATRVTISMGVRDHRLRVSVTDDGCGIRAGRNDDGYGLASMRERAQRWGGAVRVGPRPAGGASVRAVLPLPVRVPQVSLDVTEAAT